MSRKLLCEILMIALFVTAFFLTNIHVASAKKKVIKKQYTMLQGSSKLISSLYKCKVKTGNLKNIKVSKKKYIGVVAKAKKTGKSKITITTTKKKYIYTIKVLSLAKVNTTATSRLSEKVEKLEPLSKYAYTDMNGDGVTDLYADGYAYAYNYMKNKLIKRKFDVYAPNVSSMYISKKKKMIYLEASKGTDIRSDASVVPASSSTNPSSEEDEYVEYTGTDVSVFYSFHDTMYSDSNYFKILHDYSIMHYTYPAYFVSSDKYDPDKDYYCFKDPIYDQDDYYYEPFTYDGIAKKVDKMMPDRVEVPLIVK